MLLQGCLWESSTARSAAPVTDNLPHTDIPTPCPVQICRRPARTEIPTGCHEQKCRRAYILIREPKGVRAGSRLVLFRECGPRTGSQSPFAEAAERRNHQDFSSTRLEPACRNKRSPGTWRPLRFSSRLRYMPRGISSGECPRHFVRGMPEAFRPGNAPGNVHHFLNGTGCSFPNLTSSARSQRLNSSQSPDFRLIRRI